MMAPFHADARYRIVAESRIVDMLLLYGWAHRVRAGEREYAEYHAGALVNRLVSLGLPFVQCDGERRFDPAEVVNFTKWAGLNGADAVYEERFVETLRKLILDQHAANSTTPGPQRFAVRFEREFSLDSVEPNEVVRLRLPLPLEDEYLRELRVTPYSPSAGHADFSIAPGRLDARLPRPRDPTAALGVELEFAAYPITASARGAELSPAEIALYTRENEGLIRISPRIRSLAAQLAGGVSEPWQAVQRFWDYLLDQQTFGIIHYDLLSRDYPTDWPLDSGWFDCQLGAALLAALARAKGIPARLVSGYLLYPASPAEHYWTEIWMDGAWRPFDLMSADLSIQGRDPAWRNHFFGRLDCRMKTQILPRLFNANPAIRLPDAWHIVTRPTDTGSEIGFFANETGAFVHRDRISVRCIGPD